MAKLIISPLFLSTLAAIIAQIILFSQFRKLTFVKKSGALISLLGTILITLASLPITAHYLYLPLTNRVLDIDFNALKKIDVVVVLRGGGDSARVIDGILAFENSGASLFVLSGYAGTEPNEAAEVDKWRSLAEKFGVPVDAIRAEYNSMNTHEHPIEILKIPDISKDMCVGLVTSSWHMSRAMREFRKHFDNVVPIKVEHNKFAKVDWGLRMWIPQSEALYWSTYMIHEYAGSLWYRAKYRTVCPISEY